MSALAWTAEEEQALELAARWLHDPVLFVREMFGAEPDGWQADGLYSLRDNQRTGLSASKGPGKSCLLAWGIWWWEYLRVDAQAIAMSITRDNLRDNLWKELGYWYDKASPIKAAFDFGSERITSRERPKTWWVSARSFAQQADPTQQANSLAGSHAQDQLIALDEMGDYPDGVVQAAEGIFATAGQNARLIAAWNCTDTNGPAYRVSGKDRQRWHILSISGDPDDPKRSSRVDIEWARQMITDWGIDSAVVRINVRGLFPLTGSNKLIGPDDITAAERRNVQPAAYRQEPIIWSLDCARFGTDFSVLRKRQGPITWREHKFAHMDGPTLANIVSGTITREMADERTNPDHRRPDYIIVDVTGVGSSPFDHLKLLGWADVAVPVDFGSSADEERFADKRAEMYDRAARWVKTEGCLPSDSGELGTQLCEHKISWAKRGRRTCLVLESKEDMRKRGVASPDNADSLALSFAVAVPVRRDWAPGFVGGVPAEYAEHGKCATTYERSM
jgi:phage terminase large subunit